MTKYPVTIEKGVYSAIPLDNEILEVFFENRNIHWLNCNSTWGWYDAETRRWTGAVGKVKN